MAGLRQSSSHQSRGVDMALLSVLFIAQLGKSAASLPLEDFVPFGPSVDIQMPISLDGNSGPQYLNISFHFFGEGHSLLYVNTNGDITFGAPLSTFTPFDIRDVALPIVAPYWSDVDIRYWGGDIWYRQTTQPEHLDQITSDIRLAIGSDDFTASWAFVATWDNVPFYGSNSIGQQLRNTYQQILAFEESTNTSYAIMNYNTLVWSAGTDSEGNATTGRGGRAAIGGFNAGDGVNYYMLPGSHTEDVIELADTSNVGVTGKWIFRISGDVIDPFVCHEKLDLVFLVDKSGSIKNHQWNVEKRIVRELINKFQVDNGKTHVALNVFAGNVKPKWCFNDYTTRVELNAAVNGLFCSHCHRGHTGLGKVLRHTADHTLTAACGVRDNSVPKVVVVLTDGKSHEREDEATWEQQAQHLRSLPNVTVVAVGVGWHQEGLLQQIASDASLVFTAHHFDDLVNSLRPIARAACSEDDPVRTCPEGWSFEFLSQKCYKWFNETITRDEMWLKCKEHEAKPINIQRKATNHFLKSISHRHIWLDLWRLFEENEPWMWGSEPNTLGWTNWRQSYYMHTGECVVMEARRRRKWRVVHCTRWRATYICAKPRLSDFRWPEPQNSLIQK